MASDLAGGTGRGFKAMAFRGQCGWLRLTVLVALLQSVDNHKIEQSVPMIGNFQQRTWISQKQRKKMPHPSNVVQTA